MWFLAVLFIGAFILTAFFAPKPKLENARAAGLSDFNFPRSSEGDPVPRIYGTVKSKGPNTIGVCNFKAKAITKKVKTGLFSSKKQTIGYQYFIGIDMAVCLGPDVTIKRIWTGKYEIWNGCLFSNCEQVVSVNLPNLYGGPDKNGGVKGDIAIYCGSYTQSRDPYLASKLNANVPAYVGICHLVFRDFYWGNSPNIQPVYVEAACFPNTLQLPNFTHIMQNGLDANPLAILHDLYVNEWGNLKVDPALINVAQWQAAAAIVYAEGNGMSLEIANANSGADLSREILRQINGVIIENPSTGQIDFKLIRQGYDILTLPTLGPAEVVEVRNFSKRLWNETYNRVRVKYVDRANDYKEAIATAEDFANIRYQGKVRATDISMPGCYVPELAGEIAARELANLNVPLFQCELVLNRKASGVLPGSAFVFNWPEYNIVSMVMRMRKTALGTRKDGKITAQVVQDEFALDAVVMAPPTRPTVPGNDNTPGVIATLRYYEVPYFLDANSGLDTRPDYVRFGSFAVAPAPGSLAYDVYADDPNGDAQLLADAPYSTTARVAVAIDRFEGFDLGVGEVLIKELSDEIASYSEAEVRDGFGLFMIGDEIMSYESFEIDDEGIVRLLNVHRAMLDTTWLPHAVNDRVYFFDGQEGFFEDDLSAVTAVYAIDKTSSAPGDEDDASVVPLTPTGRRYRFAAPDNIQLDGVRDRSAFFAVGDTVAVSWTPRTRLAIDSITLELDAAETPEAGTLYKVEVIDSAGTIVETHDDIDATTYDIILSEDMEGVSIVNVYAKSPTGLYSFAPGAAPLNVVGESLAIDYDILTIDGERIEL